MRSAGLDFETFAVDVDESVRNGEAPNAYVRRLAMEKSARAEAVLMSGVAPAGPPPVMSAGPADRLVLGADTAVVVGGHILGKPQDAADAGRMLRLLSGRRHVVLTGFSLRCNGTESGSVESTSVEFLSLSEADLQWYLASGEGADKAGGYAIQGLASRFVTRIDGSYSNVVGLPVAQVYYLIGCLASPG